MNQPSMLYCFIDETVEPMLHCDAMASCVVSYLDTDGIRHTVEVEAETLYEAAVLALRTFKAHNCEPGAMRSLQIEVRSSVVHTLTVQKIHEWLQRGSRTPRDAVMKERLRALL